MNSKYFAEIIAYTIILLSCYLIYEITDRLFRSKERSTYNFNFLRLVDIIMRPLAENYLLINKRDKMVEYGCIEYG